MTAFLLGFIVLLLAFTVLVSIFQLTKVTGGDEEVLGGFMACVAVLFALYTMAVFIGQKILDAWA